MHLFGCKFSLRTENGDTIPDRKNFDSLLWAIVTVFQVSFQFLECFPLITENENVTAERNVLARTYLNFQFINP